jgi:hypothetical protein
LRIKYSDVHIFRDVADNDAAFSLFIVEKVPAVFKTGIKAGDKRVRPVFWFVIYIFFVH